MTEDKLLKGGMREITTKFGTILDVSIHMDELPELYRLHKEFNAGKAEEDKANWVHVQVLTGKKGNKYLKFNDYPLQDKESKPAPKATPKVEDGDSDENELPF